MNPNTVPSSTPEWLYLIIGALLAVVGSSLVEYVKLFMARRQERSYLKASFKDEIEEINAIVDKLCETWEKSKMVHKSYVIDLGRNMTTFDGQRNRIFLLDDAQLRKDLTGFYKDLRRAVEESEDKAGSLANTQKSKDEQEKIKDRFSALKQKGVEIMEKL